MKKIQLHNEAAVGVFAANLILSLIKENPTAVISLPTGKTPLPMYASIRVMMQEKKEKNMPLPWHAVSFFQLDEYVRPASGTMVVESFIEYLNRELLSVTEGIHFHSIAQYQTNPDDYEKAIQNAGGLDLVVLGIGINGHIAFNEPGTQPESLTRTVLLDETTRQSNFGTDQLNDNTPTQAITMGIQTILSARQIVLLATGEKKKAIVQQAFSDQEPNASIPASWLKRHPNVILLTDFLMP